MSPPIFYSTRNDKFFDKLSVAMLKKVDAIARERTERMLNAMRFRRPIDGGRYPKYDRETRYGHSYRAWTMTQKKMAHYVLLNAHAGQEGYKYPRNIMYGVSPTEPNHRWVKGFNNGSQKLVKGRNGRIFSSQLKNGLLPYFKRQEGLMMEDIKAITMKDLT